MQIQPDNPTSSDLDASAVRRPSVGPRDPQRNRAIAVAVMVVGGALAHYSIPPHLHLWHDILRRSMYLPIILAAVWFGTGGGVLVALVSAGLYAPHMLMQLSLTSSEEIDRGVEMVLYVIVGGLTGLLSEREKMQRRETEQALDCLQHAHDDLGEQAARLAETQEALAQVERLSTLGELAADLAHEIRNPLAAIRGTVQILAGNPAEADRSKFARIVTDEVDRLDRVVDGYLRAARAGTVIGGKADAVSALSSVIELTRHHAEHNGVRIQREGLDRLMVSMDIHRLTQVFMNLTMNAVQAMPKGGLLRVACGVAPDSDGSVAWGDISFSDTGPGVEPKYRERVFHPFFTTKRNGTGLGLSIARRLVSEHGGSLTLEEHDGPGCLLRVHLPSVV